MGIIVASEGRRAVRAEEAAGHAALTQNATKGHRSKRTWRDCMILARGVAVWGDNTRRMLGRVCGRKISSTWLSGSRPRVAQGIGREVWGRTAASEAGQYIWTKTGQLAGHARGLTMHAVRDGTAGSYRATGSVRSAALNCIRASSARISIREAGLNACSR